MFPKKIFFVAPFGDNILPRKVCPKSDFWAKCLTLFEKAAGRSESVVAGHTPKSRGINSYIKRVSHSNIGRLGVSKNFWRKKYIFFGPRFFSLFHPKFSCGRTRIFIKKKNEILSGFTTGFFLIWKREIQYFQYMCKFQIYVEKPFVFVGKR